jgi:hypothetical protein
MNEILIIHFPQVIVDILLEYCETPMFLVVEENKIEEDKEKQKIVKRLSIFDNYKKFREACEEKKFCFFKFWQEKTYYIDCYLRIYLLQTPGKELDEEDDFFFSFSCPFSDNIDMLSSLETFLNMMETHGYPTTNWEKIYFHSFKENNKLSFSFDSAENHPNCFPVSLNKVEEYFQFININ